MQKGVRANKQVYGLVGRQANGLVGIGRRMKVSHFKYKGEQVGGGEWDRQVKVGEWGKSFKREKKLDGGQGEKKFQNKKMISRLRKRKKTKSTCQPPQVTQVPKKHRISAPSIQSQGLENIGNNVTWIMGSFYFTNFSYVKY